MQIVGGRSTVLDIGTPILRVSLTNADIADAMVTSNSQLLLHGKTPGTISMFVWERAGGVRRYDISVGRDVERLTEQMKQLPRRGHPGAEQRQATSCCPARCRPRRSRRRRSTWRPVRRKQGGRRQPAAGAGAASNQVLLRVRFAEVSRTRADRARHFDCSPARPASRTRSAASTTQQFPRPAYSDLEWTKTGPTRSSSGRRDQREGQDHVQRLPEPVHPQREVRPRRADPRAADAGCSRASPSRTSLPKAARKRASSPAVSSRFRSRRPAAATPSRSSSRSSASA